jgi:hypothetical protein
VEAAAGRARDAADRWELARGLLRRMEGREQGVRPVPVEAQSGAHTQGALLPVAGPLVPLLPAGGLRRGTTVAVAAGPASTSLLLALLAEASAAGAWVGVVGRPELGLVAAAEAGVRLDRLALVPHPGRDLVAVTAALVDGLDLVAVAGAERAGVRAAERQRLAARARQRGAVLLPLGSWPGADTELSCTRAEWLGLGTGADGGGRLCTCEVQVRSRGRGSAPGGRHARLLLPFPAGGTGRRAGAPGRVAAREAG